MKRLIGLMLEDLKSKLGMIAAVWYSMGMLCLVFSLKRTIPAGEVRSLYVGPGNSSFFVLTIVFGILIGAGAFRFLGSEPGTDLYLSLPFTRQQLFGVSWLNNFMIFAVPLVVCRVLFFQISVAMGYIQYVDGLLSVGMGCLVPALGFLFVMGLSMLACLLAQNNGYRLGLFLLFVVGPDMFLKQVEKLLGAMVPSFYRSRFLETLKTYLSPVTLLSRATGVQEYMDGAFWIFEEHRSYIFALAGVALLLTVLCLAIFSICPAERIKGMFTFQFAEYFMRYGCLVLAGLWLVNGLQTFAFSGFSVALAGIAVLFGVPVLHGLLNMILAFDARKFVSAKWHLMSEMVVMVLVLGLFSMLGSRSERMPAAEKIESMAVTLPALASGGNSEEALEEMKIEGDALSDVYEWIGFICGEKGREKDSYELLVKYELLDGGSKYCRYWIPGYALATFDEIFTKEGYKRGTYAALRMDSVKYYEVQWTNGVEEYTLDLEEQERQMLLKAYQEDLDKLTFAEIRQRTPLGRLTFASTKNQGDVVGYLYPGFSKTMQVLSHYGIDMRKKIDDYQITRIVVDRYMLKDGLLYHVRYLADQQTMTDPQQIKEVAKELSIEELCVDEQLNRHDRNTEYTVYYRDSAGQTVRSVKCLKGF